VQAGRLGRSGLLIARRGRGVGARRPGGGSRCGREDAHHLGGGFAADLRAGFGGGGRVGGQLEEATPGGDLGFELQQVDAEAGQAGEAVEDGVELGVVGGEELDPVLVLGEVADAEG
jgi:hypothetical protein